MQVTIIGRKHCVRCRKARQLCRANKIPYDYKDLDAPSNAQLRHWFDIENVKTVPQIFVIADGSSQLVGGYEGFERFLKERT